MQNTLQVPPKNKETKILSKKNNEEIYRQCEVHLKEIARRYFNRYPNLEMDEIISEIWIRGISHLSNPKYYKKRIQYNTIDFFREFFNTRLKYTIKEHTCLFNDQYEYDNNESCPLIDFFPNTSEKTAEENVENKEYYEILMNMSDVVCAYKNDKEIFELRYIKEYTPSQISMITGDSTQYVNTRLNRIRKKFREQIEWKNIVY